MTAETVKTKEPRGARRKKETRNRLLKGAMALMAERGKDNVSIKEITDAADVGFGSFYNHFKSKEEVFDTLIDEVFNEFGQAIEAVNETNNDPAEIIALAVQCVLLRSNANPMWGQLLLRTAFSVETIIGGMGRYMLKDLERGVAEGRFATRDPLMCFLSVGSTVMGAISIQHSLNSQNNIAEAFAQLDGYKLHDIPQRTANTVLQILGLSTEEAEKISSMPLPELPFIHQPVLELST